MRAWFTNWTDGEGPETGVFDGNGGQPQYDGPEKTEKGDCEMVGSRLCGVPPGAGRSVEEPRTREETRGQRSSLVASHRILWKQLRAVILTAEADSLPTDAKELLHGYGLVGCHSSRSNDLSVHARIDSSGYMRLWWESDASNKNGPAAIFERKFGTKTNRATEISRERSAEQLFNDLVSVALVVESNDTSTSEDCFETTARVASMTPRRDNL